MVQSSDGLYRLWFYDRVDRLLAGDLQQLLDRMATLGDEALGLSFYQFVAAHCLVRNSLENSSVAIHSRSFFCRVIICRSSSKRAIGRLDHATEKHVGDGVLPNIRSCKFLNARIGNDEPQNPHFQYSASLLSFLLAMLSKGSIAILPAILLLIAWWKRNRITKSDRLRIARFFLIAVPLTLLNIWLEHRDISRRSVMLLCQAPRRRWKHILVLSVEEPPADQVVVRISPAFGRSRSIYLLVALARTRRRGRASDYTFISRFGYVPLLFAWGPYAVAWFQ